MQTHLNWFSIAFSPRGTFKCFRPEESHLTKISLQWNVYSGQLAQLDDRLFDFERPKTSPLS